MKIERIYLKEIYPELGGNDTGAYIDCYLHEGRAEYRGKNEPYPCLLICPGGGYGFCSPREASPVAVNFAAAGYQVFVLDYSVEPYSFPQQLIEVAAAMEVIADHEKEWECDPANVTIMGFSAGGHLAAQYSNRYDCPEVRAVFPNSKKVHRTVLSYAVLTADPEFSHKDSMRRFVGHVPADQNDTGCSCELLVTKDTPPTFLWHTMADQTVPVENSLIYAKALAAQKVPFELHIYPYGQHGLATADTLSNVELAPQVERCHKWIADCIEWMGQNEL